MENFQEDFELKKWMDSRKANKDLCGTYDFCIKCDKSLERPCEKAYVAYKKTKRKILSFSEKLALVDDTTKENLNNIIHSIEDENTKCQICRSYTSIRCMNKVIGRITLSRGVLRCHLNIDASKYNSIAHLDYSDKKTYANCPFTIIVDADQSIKNIFKLINKIKARF